MPITLAVVISLPFLAFVAISYLAGKRGLRIAVAATINIGLLALIMYQPLLSLIVFRQMCSEKIGLQGEPVTVGTGVFVDQNVFRGCLEDCRELLGWKRAHFVEAYSDPNRPASLQPTWRDVPVLEPGLYRFSIRTPEQGPCPRALCIEREKVAAGRAKFHYGMEVSSDNGGFSNIRKTTWRLVERPSGVERVSLATVSLSHGFLSGLLEKTGSPVAVCPTTRGISDLFDQTDSVSNWE